MSQLRQIYHLLCEEYALSRHVWWYDERTGKVVNDVTHTLRLIHEAAICIRRGEEDCWRTLAVYAIQRKMSYLLMDAIGEYLMDYGELEPLPLIDLTSDRSRNWRGGVVPLIDESDPVFIKAPTEKPEPNRDMAFKREHRWSRYKPRMRDNHPEPDTQTVSKSLHWLFA